MSIKLVIEPKPSDIGDNFIVRRSLPRAGNKMVGPFIFWDHMGPVELNKEREVKVRAHPHIGLATITFLFSGEIMHRDSLGNEQLIKPGEVNWMTAGRGIVHSERSKVSEPMILEGIQLWVALPQKFEQVDPSFVHFTMKELPSITHSNANLTLIAGQALGLKSPVPVYSDLFYLYGKIPAGKSYIQEISSEVESAIYITKGSLEVEGIKFDSASMVIFNPGENIEFKSSEDCEFMIFGGTPFAEKRHIWWNFVASSKELIEKAKLDWTNGEFEAVINETEIIPLPEETTHGQKSNKED